MTKLTEQCRQICPMHVQFLFLPRSTLILSVWSCSHQRDEFGLKSTIWVSVLNPTSTSRLVFLRHRSMITNLLVFLDYNFSTIITVYFPPGTIKFHMIVHVISSEAFLASLIGTLHHFEWAFWLMSLKINISVSNNKKFDKNWDQQSNSISKF